MAFSIIYTGCSGAEDEEEIIKAVPGDKKQDMTRVKTNYPNMGVYNNPNIDPDFRYRINRISVLLNSNN